jgi:hypothetical protein
MLPLKPATFDRFEHVSDDVRQVSINRFDIESKQSMTQVDMFQVLEVRDNIACETRLGQY